MIATAFTDTLDLSVEKSYGIPGVEVERLADDDSHRHRRALDRPMIDVANGRRRVRFPCSHPGCDQILGG